MSSDSVAADAIQSDPQPLRMRELSQHLKHPFVERFLQRLDDRLDIAQRELGVDRRVLDREVRLHLPRYSALELETQPETILSELLATLRPRLADGVTLARQLRHVAGAADMTSDDKVARSANRAIITQPGNARLTCRQLAPQVGFMFQEELHYLHCARRDTVQHLGLFRDGYIMPLAYASFSWCDKATVRAELARVLDRSVPPNKVLVLTRAYGVCPLPRNIMSAFLARALRIVTRVFQPDFVVTAVNPMLGFHGAVYASLDFHPFALARVTYAYNKAGLYTTRRLGNAVTHQQLPTPPNVHLAFACGPIRRQAPLRSSVLTVPSLDRILNIDEVVDVTS